jgi:ATP-dependent Clp protease adaptor protein ClpS
MTDTIIKPKIQDEIKVERPRLHKVILLNDDFTPREFVVTVLKAEFRMSEDQALRVMMTAHRRGACVVAVYTKDVAEAKATNATDAGRYSGQVAEWQMLAESERERALSSTAALRCAWAINFTERP